MKNRYFKITLLFLFLFTNGFIYSQETDTLDNFQADIYGLFRTHIAFFDGEAEIQEASPRIGTRIYYNFGKDNKYKVFFGGEFAMNLIDSDFSFQADPNNNDGGLQLLEFQDQNSTFSTRLGYFGLDLDKYGVITFGKLNSVYKGITERTDIFNVMSGQAGYVYSPTGTDGGELGTGRADNAIKYHNKLGGFEFGAQTQLRANSSKGIDEFSFSLLYNFTDHFSIGTAYNRVNLPNDWQEIDNLVGLEGDPEFYSINATYNKERLFLSATFATQENGDFVNFTDPVLDDATVIYSGKGYEFAGSYLLFKNKLKVMLGFNYKDPDVTINEFSRDFRKRFYLLGGQYQLAKFAAVYSEIKFEDSVDQLGNKLPNVYLIGLRIDFDRTFKRRID